MNRPMYETREDLQREASVAHELCKAWKCSSRKFGKAYTLDYELLRDQEVVALCEIKCRNVESNQYDTFMISMSKLEEARKISQSRKLPAFLVVHYLDDIKFISVSEEMDYMSTGGRTDRNDPMDIENVAHFKTDRLTSIYP